ncbi:MAG: LLM class F420-dependent oxidoreductase [Pseudomonadales bacterium]|nr:LLM class F420-dependent oxidoreductase [Pseudomonadales bacterium]
MKISIAMAFNESTEPGFIKDAVQLAEAKGVHGIWVPEHVLLFPDYASTYPYSDSGRMPGDPEGLLDPFTALTFIAAHTQRVRLGTGICLVPQRQPVYTAKMVADVDYLSGGRVDFGVGIGWLKEEFQNLGMDFASRGARTEEYLLAMKALWSEGISEFKGQTLNLEPCHFNPKPVQRPHPPIIFGGESDAAMRRVARLGDGWYGYDLTPEDLGRRLNSLDAGLASTGRDRSQIQVIVGPNRHPVTEQTLYEYSAVGADQVVVPMFASNLAKLEQRLDALTALQPAA